VHVFFAGSAIPSRLDYDAHPTRMVSEYDMDISFGPVILQFEGTIPIVQLLDEDRLLPSLEKRPTRQLAWISSGKFSEGMEGI